MKSVQYGVSWAYIKGCANRGRLAYEVALYGHSEETLNNITAGWYSTLLTSSIERVSLSMRIWFGVIFAGIFATKLAQRLYSCGFTAILTSYMVEEIDMEYR